MKKVLLFVVISMAMSLMVGCVSEEEKPCPEWAANLGETCETSALSISPTDVIYLKTWQVGRVQLWNASVDNVYGVEFFTEPGVKISPDQMKEGVFYTFVKTEAEGFFRIVKNDSAKIFSPDCHVLLARQTTP